MNTPQSSDLALADERIVAPSISPIAILEKAISGGVTQENVSVVKELIQMVREQRAEEAKAAFAKSFYQLRKNMPEIYADKEALMKDGQTVAYRYCSEEEISKKLEPHLSAYGFAMLPGQTAEEGRITVNVTLMHEGGHQEVRGYTVRSGSTNAMKDATAADTGAATSAWRHLMIKMFGLKSRISANQDARNEGEPITEDQVTLLKEQIAETGADLQRFLRLAGATSLDQIKSEKYDLCLAALGRKRKS